MANIRKCHLPILLVVLHFGVHCLNAERLPLAKVFGDPHFRGAEGILFDFTGIPGQIYSLFSSNDIHVNMRMEGVRSGNNLRTWVKAVSILSNNHSIVLQARSGKLGPNPSQFVSSLKVDGFPVSLTKGKRIKTPCGSLILEFNVLSSADKEIFHLKSVSGLELKILVQPENPELQSSQDSFVHFDIEFMDIPRNRNTVHGIMGQTFRPEQKNRIFNFKTEWSPIVNAWKVAGQNGEGYLDGEVEQYATSSLVSADCHFCFLSRNPKPQDSGLLARRNAADFLRGPSLQQ